VLQGIDVDVAPAESLVVIGGSGSGKSVLLKCILGLLQPDAGTIKVDGEETTVISDGARTRVSASSACCSRAAPCSIRCASGECGLRSDPERRHGAEGAYAFHDQLA